MVTESSRDIKICQEITSKVRTYISTLYKLTCHNSIYEKMLKVMCTPISKAFRFFFRESDSTSKLKSLHKLCTQ